MARLKLSVLFGIFLLGCLAIPSYAGSNTHVAISSSGRLTYSSIVVVAADGTGDYLTIQDGIDALPADGGEVHVKDGSYAPVLILKSHVMLKAIGTDVRIVAESSDVNAIQISQWNTVVSNVTIDGFHIIGTGVFEDWSSGYGVRITYANNIVVQNCLIENSGCCGITVEHASDVLLSRNRISDSIKHGINVQGDDTHDIDIIENVIDEYGVCGIMIGDGRYHPSYITISKNNVLDSAGDWLAVGIYLDVDVRYCNVTLNTISTKGQDGIQVKGQYISIVDNTVKGCANGIELCNKADHNTVRNNEVSDCTADGILQNANVDNMIGNIVTENTVTGCLYSGIKLSSDGPDKAINESEISWNICNNNADYGIILLRYCNNNRIINNQAHGNEGSPDIEDWSTGTGNIFENNDYDI